MIFGYSLLVLLTMLTFAWIKRNDDKAYAKKAGRYLRLQERYLSLVDSGSRIQSEKKLFKSAFDEIIALFDISKEITTYLDTDKVFASFSEQLRRHMDFEECRFFTDEADPEFRADAVLTLKLAGKPFGQLACRGVKEKDAEKFFILGQQFMLGMRRAILYQKVQEMATMDSLTHIFSRRYWFERSGQELARSLKFDYRCSCLMLDVDHFKDINDRYGHLVGDAILVEVSRIIRENIRQIDLLGKYGGEEFCLLLTETDTENAVLAAERIRAAVEAAVIRAYDESLSSTISIGISAFPGDAHELSGLIDSADSALYAAKQSGRNKVCVYTGGTLGKG